MTAENSSMVDDPTGGATRVLNSLIGLPTIPLENVGSKPIAQTIVENYLAGGSWADTGPIDTSLINTAITDTLKNQTTGIPGAAPVTQNKTYKMLRSSFDSLGIGDQPSAIDQVTQAWKRAYDAQPDKIPTSYETGGKNGHTIKGTGPNPVKSKLSTALQQVTSDLYDAYSQNQVTQINETLSKTAELISDAGEKVSSYAGEKYKQIAADITNAIRNFQGKTIRNFDDAMNSLNKLTSNPGMNINQADRDALINAWNNVDAQDMANKMGNLAKAFKAADIVQKVVKVKEKSIEGYETGNWAPLMLEVETWELSGLFGGVAVSIAKSVGVAPAPATQAATSA
ncbi:colicin-like pore-forming protein [Erwiniaceae bacterium L1_54_6]|nr:colicin-like pore-forming protein [Erwiniaceae bacterium L1_54_6]